MHFYTIKVHLSKAGVGLGMTRTWSGGVYGRRHKVSSTGQRRGLEERPPDSNAEQMPMSSE